MQAKGKREIMTYPQSAGHLALADESLAVLQTPKAKTRSQVQSVRQDNTEEASDTYALAPATGMIVDIILTMYWIHVQL